MTKKILIWVCLISLMAMSPAFAANWRFATESDDGKRYIDIETVRSGPDNMTFWQKLEWEKHADLSSTVCLQKMVYSQGQMFFRDVQCTFYRKDGTSWTKKEGAWNAVIPGSVMDAVISFAKRYARP